MLAALHVDIVTFIQEALYSNINLVSIIELPHGSKRGVKCPIKIMVEVERNRV